MDNVAVYKNLPFNSEGQILPFYICKSCKLNNGQCNYIQKKQQTIGYEQSIIFTCKLKWCGVQAQHGEL